MADLLKPLVLTQLNAGSKIADDQGIATPTFRQIINNAFRNISLSDNSQSDLLERIIELNGLLTSVDEKITAQAATTSLANSYTNPTSVLTSSSDGTTGTITIAAHTRVYGDATSVAVNGGTITGLTPARTFYVFYHDQQRAGGAVSFFVSENASDAAQVGDVHCAGVAYVAGEVDTGSPGGGSGGPGVPSGRFDRPRLNEQ